MENKIRIVSCWFNTDDGIIINCDDSVYHSSTSSFSKTGSLRLDFTRGNPKYISQKHFNNYSVQNIGNRDFMVFTEDYDENTVKEYFSYHHLNNIKMRMHSLNNMKSIWESVLQNCSTT